MRFIYNQQPVRIVFFTKQTAQIHGGIKHVIIISGHNITMDAQIHRHLKRTQGVFDSLFVNDFRRENPLPFQQKRDKTTFV